MRPLISTALILSAWTMYVNAQSNETVVSVKSTCELLNSIFVDVEMLTRFNGVFFQDFKTGRDFRSQGALSIGGSFVGENAYINERYQLGCKSESESPGLGDYGLILKGTTNSTIVVNGFANTQEDNSNIMTPLDDCYLSTAYPKYDFALAKENSISLSRHFAGMLPNWSIDKMGVILKIVTEGISIDQPFNVFTMAPNTGPASAQLKSYFACTDSKVCETPVKTLSDPVAMLLQKNGTWVGPTDQAYPEDNLVIFNIPVLNGQILDIETKNPSVGLKVCNTIYNFYAVDQEGKFEPEGHFTLKRSSKLSLNGMILAPQAHIIDIATGSFAGQVIADSYESADDSVQIFDYESAGGIQCQVFAGCVTTKKSAKPGQDKTDDFYAPPPVEHKSNTTDPASSAVISSVIADSPSTTSITSWTEPEHSITEASSTTEPEHSNTEIVSTTEPQNSATEVASLTEPEHSITEAASMTEPNHSNTGAASVNEPDHSITEVANMTEPEHPASVNYSEHSVTEVASMTEPEHSISGNTNTIASEVSEPSQVSKTDNGNEAHTVTEGGEITNNAEKIEGEEIEVNPDVEGSDGETSGEDGSTE